MSGIRMPLTWQFEMSFNSLKPLWKLFAHGAQLHYLELTCSLSHLTATSISTVLNKALPSLCYHAALQSLFYHPAQRHPAIPQPVNVSPLYALWSSRTTTPCNPSNGLWSSSIDALPSFCNLVPYRIFKNRLLFFQALYLSKLFRVPSSKVPKSFRITSPI